MSEKASLKKETKKEIRAVLLSTPKGLSAREVLADYRNFQGRPLPFRELGYNSAEDFFRDIPDVCTLDWVHGELVLRGVADESTKHIERLVSRQVAKKSKRPSRRPPPRRPPRPPQQPTVPPFLRVRIRELLTSYPSGLLGSSFGHAFLKRFGQNLPYNRRGFKSISDLLRSIPDIVDIEELRGGGFRLHAKTSRLSTANRNEAPSSYSRYQGTTHRLSLSSENEDDSISQFDEPPDEDDGMNEQFKKELREVISRRKNGMWAARLPFEFKQVHNKELSCKEYGFASVIELVSSLPDIFTIERPNPQGDWLLYDAQTWKPKSPSNKVPESAQPKSSVGTKPEIDPNIKEAVRQVLLANPDGVSYFSLPEVYKELVGEDLPIQEMGFCDLESLVLDLTDVIHMQHKGEGQVLLFAADPSELPGRKVTDFLKQHRAEKESIQGSIPRSLSRKGIPPDAVGPGACYTRQVMPQPSPANPQPYLEVYVSNVVNPGRFWLMLKGDHTTLALEELMDRLEEVYYGQEGDRYALPESLIAIGQPCVAIFPEDQNWHRVSITGIPNIDFVEVYYVDYGNTCCVPKSSLKMLKTRFLKLPAQAIRARLSNIRPTDKNGWSKKSTNRMLKLCVNKLLVALETPSVNNVCSVCLCDTSDPNQDVHINDVLCAEGLAEFWPDDEDLVPNTDPPVSDQPILPPDLSAFPQPTIQSEAITAEEAVAHHASDTGPANLLVESVTELAQLTKECAENAEGDTDEESDVDEDLIPRCVKFIELTEVHSMHLICYQDKGYVTSAEISSYLWEKDILRSSLRHTKTGAEIKKVVLAQDDEPELFEELKEYEVPGIVVEGVMKSHITLYELDSVLTILDTLECQEGDLLDAISEQIKAFDPEDPYWQGEDSDEEEDDSSSASDSLKSAGNPLNLEELNLAVKALQFRRQRIIDSMVAGGKSHAVDELDQVEARIVKINQMIKDLCSKDAADQGKGVLTEEQLINTLMEQQYQMPADSGKNQGIIQPKVCSY
ncbi:tudor domain-containing protein 5 isoform X2 [Lingula anatina]|uniref:Tudor domain-containing protein 5 isoform X2 n=1 Tax=Lingula anatina TaxID=7574 RepID=A0A1S3IVV2_LINAN|nr:tudor domain-containing protein 5 isoform X2 [Lingula anatina]|eukprot:XP_013402320.1 tudor domain-containing protein 5 isoform X2 [Lingula anatina]